MALDKFFCKVADTKANDKSIEFPSEKEAIEYCKENGINPHGIILMGDKYIIKTKDSGFKTTMDEAIKLCDASNYSKSFFSRKQAEAFVEQLKKQGIKAIITVAADPLNKGSVMYRVEWN